MGWERGKQKDDTYFCSEKLVDGANSVERTTWRGENTEFGAGVEFKLPVRHSLEVTKGRIFLWWVHLQKHV